MWKCAVFEMFFVFVLNGTLRKVRLAHLDELEKKNGILETEKRVLKTDNTALLSENADLKRQNDELKRKTEHLQQKLRRYEEQCNCQAGGGSTGRRLDMQWFIDKLLVTRLSLVGLASFFQQILQVT